MYHLRFEAVTGNSVQFEPLQVQPLGLDELLAAMVSNGYALPLEFVANDALVDGTVVPGRSEISMPIQFSKQVSIFTLIQGGWLPPALIPSPRLLVDRNVVSALVRARPDSRRFDRAVTSWWMDQIGDAWLNPLPYALEGSIRAMPEFEAFVHDFDRASAELSVVLPQARLVDYGPPHYRAAYRQISALKARRDREAEFLLQIVPSIFNRVGAARLHQVEGYILQEAERRELAKHSMVVLAALSCLYEDEDRSRQIGRRVLKPKPQYTAGDAHNALTDLSHLELLIATRAIEHDGTLGLCTQDKGLAMLWCALAPRYASYLSPGIEYIVKLDKRLFPRLDSVARLGEELEGRR